MSVNPVVLMSVAVVICFLLAIVFFAIAVQSRKKAREKIAEQADRVAEQTNEIILERDSLSRKHEALQRKHQEYVETFDRHYAKVVDAYKWYRDEYAELRKKKQSLFDSYLEICDSDENKGRVLESAKKELSELTRRLAMTEKCLAEERLERETLAAQRAEETERYLRQQSDREQLSAQLQSIKQEYEIENSHLSEALAAAKERLQEHEQCKETVARLESASHGLHVQIEVLRNQLGELDQVRKENEALREQMDEMQSLRESVAHISAENAALRAKGVVVEQPSRPKTLKMPAGLGSTLNDLLKRIGQTQGYRSAAVSDEIGLPVAGHGQWVDGLAGLAAIFGDIDERVQNNIAFGTLKKLIAKDVNDLTLTIQPLHMIADPLLLATLTVGEGPDV
jgi:uncharacterized protein YoxC